MQWPYHESLFDDSLEVHGVDWIIVFAYFDETGTHDSAPDTVVAGYLFSKDGAKRFRQTFMETIYPLLPPDKYGRRIYHSTKCIGGYEPYDTLSIDDREHIVDLMVDAIKNSVALGCVVGMEKQEYAKALANSPILRQLAGSEYTVCLHRCIENMAAWVNEKEIQGRIQYVFEAGCKHQQEANDIFARISKSEELKKRYRWHSFSFVEKGLDVPQLGVPDLLAWEWQRARVNSLNRKRGEWRLTLKKLVHGPPKTPHLLEYESETAVGIRALVNAFYGITSATQPIEISNPFFYLKDFPN